LKCPEISSCTLNMKLIISSGWYQCADIDWSAGLPEILSLSILTTKWPPSGRSQLVPVGPGSPQSVPRKFIFMFTRTSHKFASWTISTFTFHPPPPLCLSHGLFVFSLKYYKLYSSLPRIVYLSPNTSSKTMITMKIQCNYFFIHLLIYVLFLNSISGDWSPAVSTRHVDLCLLFLPRVIMRMENLVE
jgi:hypothetical protein